MRRNDPIGDFDVELQGTVVAVVIKSTSPSHRTTIECMGDSARWPLLRPVVAQALLFGPSGDSTTSPDSSHYLLRTSAYLEAIAPR